ncbi:MAG: hypothetical protein Q9184_008127 [Pyrenodesmia sp. 2 TL-2023]
MAYIDPFTGKQASFRDSILIPTAKFGAFCGVSGLLVGGAAGIIRSPTPGLFAIASGLQWTLLASRILIFRAWKIEPSSPLQERILPSTLAGAFTGGTMGGVLSTPTISDHPYLTNLFTQPGGRANVVPGIIMFSLFGFAGQHAYNYLDRAPASKPTLVLHKNPDPSAVYQSVNIETPEEQPLWKRVLNSKYSPMKVLSDKQYEDLLREKLLGVEAEIAIVEEKIIDAKAKAMAEADAVSDRQEKKVER